MNILRRYTALFLTLFLLLSPFSAVQAQSVATNTLRERFESTIKDVGRHQTLAGLFEPIKALWKDVSLRVQTIFARNTRKASVVAQVSGASGSEPVIPAAVVPDTPQSVQTKEVVDASFGVDKTLFDALRARVADLENAGIAVTSSLSQSAPSTMRYSNEDLDAKFQDLSNRVLTELFRVQDSASSAQRGNSSNFQAIALTNKIDQITNVTLINPTVQGRLIIEDSSGGTPASFSVGGNGAFGGLLTVTGSTTLSDLTTSGFAHIEGNLFASSTVLLTSGLTAYGSSTFQAITGTSARFSDVFQASSTALFGTGFVSYASSTLQEVSATQISLGSSSPFATLSINAPAGAIPFAIGSSTKTALIVNAQGNLSVGTATSTEKLTVGGSIASLLSEGTDILRLATSTAVTGDITDRHDTISAVGKYLYVGAGTIFNIIDATDPTFPVIVSTSTIGSTITGVTVAGNYAYVVDSGSDTLKIIDISRPASTTVVSTLSVGTAPQSVKVAGSYAFVLDDGTDTIYSIDISNPLQPKSVSSVALTSGSYEILTYHRGFLYTGRIITTTVEIVDATNPLALLKVAVFTSAGSGWSRGVALSGNTMYVSRWGGNLSVVDVGNPSSPREVSIFSAPSGLGNPNGIYVAGRYLYVSRESSGITAFDISSSTNPVSVGSLSVSGTPRTVIVAGRYAYMPLQTTDTVAVVDLGGVETTSLTAGSIDVGQAQLRNDLSVGGRSNFYGPLNVGTGGIFSTGSITAGFASSTSQLSVAGTFIGNVGVGTSSAYARLTVVSGGTGTARAFEVLDSASTTRLSILDNGLVSAGNLLLTSSTTLQNFTAINATTSNATSTSLYALILNAITASTTNLTTQTLLANSSTTLQNFTYTSATSTGLSFLQNLASHNITLSQAYSSIITAAVGSSTGYTNFSGGIGTGGADSIGGAFNNALRITHTGNLVNIGSIQAGETLLTSGGTFADKVDYTLAGAGAYASLGDVNGDGKADMVMVNSSGASVLINNGNGIFADKIDYAIGAGSTAGALGDVNGDGKADLAVTNFSGGTVSVLINNGNGTFADKVDYTAGSGTYYVALGDVNGDGKADMVVSNESSATASVFINNGNGTFAAKADYGTGGAPNGIALGDVNGDGKADMMVVNNTSNTISVLMNNGNGTFATQVTYGVGARPRGLTLGDVNGDGKLDMATPNNSGASVSVLINNGNGTFASAVSYATLGGPFGVAFGDVNGDGKADMVVANYSVAFASVFINNGNGTFATKVDYTLGSGGSTSVALGDLNGDGKADMVLPNNSSALVSVFLNQSNPILYANASSGNLGVGTSTPTTTPQALFAKLTVWAANTLSGGRALNVVGSASSTLFTVTNDGLIGAGTSTPYASLTVTGRGIGTLRAFEVVDSASSTKFYITDAGTIHASSTALFTNGLMAYASTTLQNFTAVNSTSSQATSTSFFATLIRATTGRFTSLFADNLELAGSTTLQNFTGVNATTTNATSTSLALIGLAAANASDDTLCISATNVVTRAVTCSASSLRFKENVATTTDALTIVRGFRPVSFNYIDVVGERLGFIAEEVQLLDPRLVFYDADGTTPRGVRYQEVIPLLTGAVQDIDTRTSFITSSSTVSSFFVDELGNVAIGTSTNPLYKLAVGGDIAATGFVNVSTASAKKDIEHLDAGEESAILDKIALLGVATYHYNAESSDSPLRMGLIAEEAPHEVLSADGKGIDLYKLVSFALAGIKAQQARIEELASRIGLNFGEEIQTKKLCLEDVCVTKDQLRELLGGGTAQSVTTPEVVTATSSEPEVLPDPIDTEAPVISLVGDSAIELPEGVSWIDPGATVTDNVNSNLGIVTTGGPVDTSILGDVTLHYNATDGAGNSALEVTRLVRIIPGL